MKVLITGSQGFIGSYLCEYYLQQGHTVVGIDDYSKYGRINRAHDSNDRFTLYEEDVVDIEKRDLERFSDVEIIIAGAAMIGGISYFHKYAYDLLAKNERIIASTFDLAIALKQTAALKKIVVMSSSMVYESSDVFPTPETEIYNAPPPLSTYGFQKLSCEYFCKGAFEQYGLPYVIVRPFNCVGVGEDKALGHEVVTSGNIELMMSHVLPDLINKAVKGQYPLRILGSGGQVRCYTNGKDIARGIYLASTSERAINQDFNISAKRSTSVVELAELVWRKLGIDKPFKIESDTPFEYDVQYRVPDTKKALDVLGFEAEISLEKSIEEVIEYIKNAK
jgi:nucleoside-diphosphate-sugar epimerase